MLKSLLNLDFLSPGCMHTMVRLTECVAVHDLRVDGYPDCMRSLHLSTRFLARITQCSPSRVKG